MMSSLGTMEPRESEPQHSLRPNNFGELSL